MISPIWSSLTIKRRRQRQGVAGDAQHQVVVVEGAVERVEAALAGQVRTRREVDAGGQAHGADVHHVRLALQRHHGIGEFGLELVGALEQLFVAVDIQRRKPAAQASGCAE